MLWCDGDHGFNPYDFAELNLVRGFDAEWGAERLLVKRCMTPFQWDSVLTKHLAAKLEAQRAALTIVAPYENLFSTDELQDWEREDYIEFSLMHLKGLAERHRVPVVISVDMARWTRAHPLVAWKAYEAASARWAVRPKPGGWMASEVTRGLEAASPSVRQATLVDFAPSPEVVLAPARERLQPVRTVPASR